MKPRVGPSLHPDHMAELYRVQPDDREKLPFVGSWHPRAFTARDELPCRRVETLEAIPDDVLEIRIKTAVFVTCLAAIVLVVLLYW